MSETIGLDIGSHSIKVVGLKMTSKGMSAYSFWAQGNPSRERTRSVQITFPKSSRILLEEIGIKPGKVSLTVSGSGVNIQRISIPSTPKAELKEAVRWEINGRLPFPAETAQISFPIVGEFVKRHE